MTLGWAAGEQLTSDNIRPATFSIANVVRGAPGRASATWRAPDRHRGGADARKPGRYSRGQRRGAQGRPSGPAPCRRPARTAPPGISAQTLNAKIDDFSPRADNGPRRRVRALLLKPAARRMPSPGPAPSGHRPGASTTSRRAPRHPPIRLGRRRAVAIRRPDAVIGRSDHHAIGAGPRDEEGVRKSGWPR